MEKVTETLVNCIDKVVACIDLALDGGANSNCGHEMAYVFDDVEDEVELYTKLKAGSVDNTDEEMVANGDDAVDCVAALPNRREIEEIRAILMQFDQKGNYIINHRFRPLNLYRFHVTAFLRGDRASYLAGRWSPGKHQLLCRTCARWCDEEPIQDGEKLYFVDYTIQMRSSADGLVVIPYYARPSYYLTETKDFVENRDELAEEISNMFLDKYDDKDFICWEFHCYHCYVNLFTKNVINVTGYVTNT